MTKRLRLFALGTTVVLLAALTLAGGSYLRAAATAHADSGGKAIGQIPLDTLTHAHLGHEENLPALKHANGHIGLGIPNIDSIPNFSGKYHADGFDPNGNANKQWVYNTVGNPPQQGGTTTIRVPIIPVSLDLLNPDGSLFIHDDAASDVPPTLNSPLFQNANYSSSSTPTQFDDAIQRAEYASSAKSDWHTILQPVVEPAVTLEIPWDDYGAFMYTSGPRAGQIEFVLLDDTFTQELLFPTTFSWPPDTSTVMGALEASGEITPHDLTTFLFPDTFTVLSNPCCFIFAGLHWYDTEPGDASNGNLQRYFIFAEASYYTNDFEVGGGVVTGIEDVSTLSHEYSEALNDPFVLADGAHDITPWWSSGFECQDLLETGDVIETLPNQDYPITMNGMTYHPQNEALLQWFEGMTPSDATGGAYSYPDTSILTAPSPANIPVNCGQ
jgi:hypothetical protein